MYIRWGKNKANTFSLCEIGGETGYTSQKDWKSINSYNMGEGRMIGVWFFYSWIPRLSLVLSAFLSLGHQIPPSIVKVDSLAPFGTLLRPLGTQSQRERGNNHSRFFRLYRGVVGLWVFFACSLSGWFMEGDESPGNDKVACFSIVWVLAREHSCCTTTWRFVIF